MEPIHDRRWQSVDTFSNKKKGARRATSANGAKAEFKKQSLNRTWGLTGQYWEASKLWQVMEIGTSPQQIDKPDQIQSCRTGSMNSTYSIGVAQQNAASNKHCRKCRKNCIMKLPSPTSCLPASSSRLNDSAAGADSCTREATCYERGVWQCGMVRLDVSSQEWYLIHNHQLPSDNVETCRNHL